MPLGTVPPVRLPYRTNCPPGTEAEIRARRGQVALLRAIRESVSSARILGSAPESGPRESRRIRGVRVMTGEEYLEKHIRLYSLHTQFVDRHLTQKEVDHFFFFGSGNSSYMDVSSSVRNSRLSTLSTSSISLAPS